MITVKKIIKGIFYMFGFKIEYKYQSDEILRNVFNSNFNKKVLLAYIKTPFFFPIDRSHSNKIECFTAAEIFHNVGYQVDIIDFRNESFRNYDCYEIVYGFGIAFENSFYSRNTKLKRIFYGTGCCPLYSNIESTKKVISFYERTNFFLPESARLVKEALSLSMLASNAIIALGNEFVLNTYRMVGSEITKYFSLNAFYFKTCDIDIENKDFKKAQNHFLWFGSPGLLHKGLDILIEIFSKSPNIVLHICGAWPDEKRFIEIFQKEIEQCRNIKKHGFIDIDSDEFKKLMDTCAFVVFPSVSEGGAVSILNVMGNGGLIPIISKSVGLDVDKFGWQIDNVDINDFEMIIKHSQKIDFATLKAEAIKIKEVMQNYFSYEAYKLNLRAIIKEILN